MFVTTIKHAKQVLSVFLAVLLICQSAVAAGQKTKFELGLEAAAGAKWDIAIKYFKGVTEDDEKYKDARKQIVIAQEEQEKALAKSKFQNKFKQETDKCRDLFHIERSPETQKCIERVNELNKEGMEKFGGIALPTYQALTVDYSPYRTINEVTERLRGIVMDENGMENAGTDLMFIESFVADPKMPVDAKVIGAIFGTTLYKGATLAYKESCEFAQQNGDEKSAAFNCQRQQQALGKYATFRNFVVENSPALTGKSVPLLIWNEYNPLSQTISALPEPGAMVVANSKNSNTNSNAPRIGAGETGTQKTQVIQPVEEQPSSWMPYAVVGSVATLIAVVTGWYWKTSAKSVAASQAGQVPSTTVASSAQRTPPKSVTPKATSPKGGTTLVNAVAQGTMKAVSPSAKGMVASAVSSAFNREAAMSHLKGLLEAWLKGDRVAKASDMTLKAVQSYAFDKLGIQIDQLGRPHSASLDAVATDKAVEGAKAFIDLIISYQRSK